MSATNDSSGAQRSAVGSGLAILQVFTFYEAYLENFYKARPWLAQAPFNEQMHELYQDGFGVLHVYAPALTELGCRATWVVANCYQAQLRWAYENNVSVTAENWKEEILRAQISSFNPDALYFLNSIDFDSRFIRSLAKRPAAVIGWRAAEIPAHVDWSEFDLIVSHLSVCRAHALKIGAHATEYFHPSVPKFLGEMSAAMPREYDVVFTGQWTPQHHERNLVINAIAEAAEREGFTFGLFLSSHNNPLPPAVARFNQGARWGHEMYRALRSGRIVINAEIDLARGEAGNMRLFETASVGSFLLTEYQLNIEKYFKPGKHIDTYRSVEELLEKIRFYLRNPTQREEMAQAAQRHIQTEFSPINGARELVGFCKKILSQNSTKADVEAEALTPDRTVDLALNELKNGKVKEALSMVERVTPGSSKVRDLEFVRGICFGKLARFDEAVRALEAELSAFPDNVPARELLSYVSSGFQR